MTRRRSRLTSVARILRKGDNIAEAQLWLALRNRNLNGFKFRRQLPVGPYIADFVCPDCHLVVELDGSQHIDNPQDAVRDAFLHDQGWSLARFWSGDVLANKDTILDTLAAICEGRISETIESYEFRFYPARLEMMEATPHPNPLPSGGERGQDTGFMRRAIELARAQLGRTWPNPAVGCVIVSDGVVLAEAATGDGGRPHAEEQALKLAGDAARGATAYVTLEPCGGRSSGAASCSQRLIEAGVGRVVFACADPSPYAAKQGVLRMEAAGVAVESGLLAEEAASLIAGFVHYLATGLPLLRLGAQGVDAMFEPQPGSDTEAELRACAAFGYRTLGVAENSDLAATLRTGGWLTTEVKI